MYIIDLILLDLQKPLITAKANNPEYTISILKIWHILIGATLIVTLVGDLWLILACQGNLPCTWQN